MYMCSSREIRCHSIFCSQDRVSRRQNIQGYTVVGMTNILVLIVAHGIFCRAWNHDSWAHCKCLQVYVIPSCRSLVCKWIRKSTTFYSILSMEASSQTVLAKTRRMLCVERGKNFIVKEDGMLYVKDKKNENMDLKVNKCWMLLSDKSISFAFISVL